MIDYKKCSRCKDPKALVHFSVDKRGKYGLRSTCKECDKEYRKKHYQENHEAIREKQNIYLKKYHQENQAMILKKKKEYYATRKMGGGDAFIRERDGGGE